MKVFVNGNTLNLRVSPLKSDESMATKLTPNQKGDVFRAKHEALEARTIFVSEIRRTSYKV